MPKKEIAHALKSVPRRLSAWIILLLLVLVSGCAWNPDFRRPVQAGQEELTAENTRGERFGAMTPELQERFKAEIRSYWESPYLWGGNAPSGIDCSGLVGQIYKRAAAIDLPRTTLKLFALGMSVENQPLQFADLVFFKLGHASQPDHVGFYVARGYFIHASVTRGVTLSLITDTPYRESYAGARRLLQ
ncbi:MAG TPA: C40 family peptidase [bacterium]|nr:C40 family peptidase [bacterium]HQG47001.1 C40 family peptidase [bacterium]HQI47659.1 C40 family peptidase [bacterium]HQJ63265.1 C40 family peptidase [bacterium]